MLDHLSPEERKAVKDAVEEAAGSLYRVASEADLRKEIANKIKDEYELKPAIFNKLVQMYYRQNKHEVQENTDQIVGVYESLFDVENAE